jgi:hypothetical protein
LYRGLLGGADSALAWGIANKAALDVSHPGRTWQLAQAIETWEDEGGAVSPMTRGGARECDLRQAPVRH